MLCQLSYAGFTLQTTMFTTAFLNEMSDKSSAA